MRYILIAWKCLEECMFSKLFLKIVQLYSDVILVLHDMLGNALYYVTKL